MKIWESFGRFFNGRCLVSILRTNGIFYGNLGHFVAIWYIFTRFGMLYREKSGNPVPVFFVEKNGFPFVNSKESICQYGSRVARLFLFKPKIPI
jgi:hypothetical protein